MYSPIRLNRQMISTWTNWRNMYRSMIVGIANGEQGAGSGEGARLTWAFNMGQYGRAVVIQLATASNSFLGDSSWRYGRGRHFERGGTGSWTGRHEWGMCGRLSPFLACGPLWGRGWRTCCSRRAALAVLQS